MTEQKRFIQSKIDKALEDNKLRHEKAVADIQKNTTDQVLEYEMLTDLEDQNIEFTQDMINFMLYCSNLQDSQKLDAIVEAITKDETVFNNIIDLVIQNY